MKNILLSILTLVSLVACKKENKNLTKPTECFSTRNKADMIVNSAKPAINFSAATSEISVGKASEFLKAKQNDTLYITNFFATWCGPCRREIPHFKEKMEELKDKPVKFTFISLDDKTDWDEAVKNFAEENNLQSNVLLLDGNSLSPEFFKQNFKDWDGSSIPFTFMRKGNKTDETKGMLTKEELSAKIKSFD